MKLLIVAILMIGASFDASATAQVVTISDDSPLYECETFKEKLQGLADILTEVMRKKSVPLAEIQEFFDGWMNRKLIKVYVYDGCEELLDFLEEYQEKILKQS